MCVSCGACVASCPTRALEKREDGSISFFAERCVQCDTCIRVCPHDSSPRTFVMSAAEVYDHIWRQIPFIRGITVSGGECMLHPCFLTDVFRMAKRNGLSTLIDSNGTISFEENPELMEVTDGVMLDIKAFDPEDHIRITGEDNRMVLENAVYLAKTKKLYEVRAVIVPDLYDGEKSIRGIAKLLAPYLEIQQFRIKLIKYRPMGVREAYAGYRIPDDAYMQSLEAILRNHGFENIIIV